MADFQDDDHALRTGMFIGALMQVGIQVILELDENQNYRPLMTIIFPGDRFVEEVTVHIQVLPGLPPD